MEFGSDESLGDDKGTVDKIHALHKGLLFDTIAIDYLDPSIQNGLQAKKFRAKCRQYLKEPMKFNVEDVDKLLETLESKGFIGIGDYDTLREMTADIDVKIIQEIDRAELKIENQGGNIKRRNYKRKFVEYENCHRGIGLVIRDGLANNFFSLVCS